MLRFRSVVSRIMALHLAAIMATSIGMPVALYLMLRSAADTLHQEALRDQAIDITRFLATRSDGSLRLTLPEEEAQLYSTSYGRYAYAVIDGNRRVLFSSLPGGGPLTEPRLSPGLRLFRATMNGAELFGLSLPTHIGAEPVWIQVGQDLAHRDVLIDDIVAQFFPRVGWVIAPILLVLLVIDIVIFRRALFPIIEASRHAEAIGPTRTDLRLPIEGMPDEVLPLVGAVNQALDRLAAGFQAQRDFTADAAHELRTPLTILRMQIDMIPDSASAALLRKDVEAMSRLVNQLLEYAELETLLVDAEEIADLSEVAQEVASFVAPLALAQHKNVAVLGADEPVRVPGNADALARALRNLVENALVYTPPESAVEIEVDAAGALHVSDQGPGVSPEDRDRIFRRFWRRDRRRPGSGGLGLSIVSRIATLHGATVSVADGASGGARFTIRFPETETRNSTFRGI